MRAGKIVALVSGIFMVLIALAMVVPGGVLLGMYGTQRDADGFFQTSGRTLSSNGYALVTPDVNLNMGPLAGDYVPTGDRVALRIKATSSAEAPLFIGIGPSGDVARYLAGVEYDEVTDFGWGWHSVRYRHLDGVAPAVAPADEDFWVGRQQGSGTISLDWAIEDGSWTAVVMNADASASVSADVRLGARFDILLPIGIGLTVGGVILLGAGILLIVLGARRSKTPPNVQGQMPLPVAPPPSVAPPSAQS